ncbi:MAG: hypothetical protein Q7J98_08075 [Kiritimatiellia bacterium]|nr:hypothetical protein [Kiritimatiellia bacterium]
MKEILSSHSFASTARTKVAAMMFCLGLNAMLAQIIMTRELMVAFYGNELTIGIIFAVWLLMVSAGSLAIRPFLSGLSEKGLYSLAAGLLVASAVALPLLIFAARALRMFFDAPLGMYLALMQLISGTFLVLAPICLIVGIVFPIACRLAVLGNGNVAAVYAAESAGGMVAGLAFSFVFVYLLPPVGAALAASVGGLCGAALIAPRASIRKICWVTAAGLVMLLMFSGPIGALEMKGVKLRWESFGILPRGNGPAAGQPRLIDSRDSRYQNVAIIESAGQQTLYGNGQIMFVFPDEIFAEQKIHFIMAQKPDARRVLLIGGSPVNDIPELLKYPLQRLTHVELDALINDMLFNTGGNEYRRALSDPRLQQCLMDGPRFVKQTREKFDVVIVEGPEPTTLALNRFYTAEFYRSINRILAPGGFLYTAVNSSEQMQDEAASITASVCGALQTVFPRLLVTAGPRNQFFAGKKNAPLTFDGKILCERWSAAGIKTKYFRPEYFLSADEISADKTDFVHRRISDVSAPINSALRPVSAFYNLSLWSRYSGSRLEHLFNVLKPVRFEWVAGAVAAFAILLLIFVVILLGQKTARAAGRAERIIITAVIAATGFAGMALELVLIFIFQTLLGYIYASIGLIMAMFMMGLALGALFVRKYSLPAEKRWLLLFELDAVLLLTAVSLPFLIEHDPGALAWPVAGVIYFLTLLTGWAGGAQFILAAGLLNEKKCGADYYQPSAGARIPRNIALLNAVDLAAAALGGISIGIIFLPLFGFGGACYLLAILKAGTASLIGAFLVFCPPKR